MLDYNVCCDMLNLSMLVYDYNKNFIIDEEKNPLIKDVMNDLHQDILNETIKNYLQDTEIYKFYNIKKTDLQVGITINKRLKRISIIFRGSESKKDWYYDLQIRKDKLDNGVLVHKGFNYILEYNNTEDKIINDIKDILNIYTDYKLYLTGHSLGAGLSLLFGYKLSKKIKNNICIVGFAGPRVGNKKFKKDLESIKNLECYRITNEKDIVTAFPFINFYHVGHNIRLYDNEIKIFMNSNYGKFDFTIFKCYSIKEHFCEAYYNRLNKLKF